MEATVEVAPGSLRFDPDTVELAVGGTIEWVWKSSGHNIVVESQPSGANWDGTPGDSGETYDEGYSYTYTFETAGMYEYYCAPHEGVGMDGSITVR